MTTLRFDWLQALPAYWRGRAKTRAALCLEALQSVTLAGDDEALSHARKASEYEATATWLEQRQSA